MLRIMIVEDDANQRTIMTAFLKGYGYDVIGAEDGERALAIIDDNKVDMVICDIMMPGMDGYELTRVLRSYDKGLPILMVTAKGDFSDKQLGFLAGTDDYMVKPVDLDELLLRVKALFRRANLQGESRIEVGRAVLNAMEWSVMIDDEKMTLPRKEFMLLYTLLSYPGKILTRRQLMDEVWGQDCETDERTVDVHIRRLREKLSGIEEFNIETIRGLGYRSTVKTAKKV